jgi:hypothetical protein
VEELQDAAKCEQYYGEAQLAFLYSKLAQPRDFYVVVRGSPGFSGGASEHTDSMLWCPKERARMINRINAMTGLDKVVFVGGDHHRTYTNAVTEFAFHTVEFVCSAITMQGATPEGAFPTHGRVLSTDPTFSGNRLCTLDLDADKEELVFTEWQMRVADRTELTPGMRHTIPFSAFGRKPVPAPAMAEDLVVHCMVTMDMRLFEENTLLKFGLVSGAATAWRWSVRLDIQTTAPATTFEALGYVTRPCPAGAEMPMVCVHGPMVWDQDITQIHELVTQLPIDYVLKYGDQVSATVVGVPLVAREGLTELTYTLRPVTAATSSVNVDLSSSWHEVPKVILDYGPFANVVFKEDFEGAEWAAEKAQRVEMTNGEYSDLLNPTYVSAKYATYTLPTGTPVFNFSVNSMVYASEEAAGQYTNAAQVMNVVEDTFYAMDTSKPCASFGGNMSAHPSNPLGAGPAQEKGCMVGAPHRSKWLELSTSSWSKMAMRGGPFDAIQLTTSARWRITYKFSQLGMSGWEPVLYGIYDPMRFPAGGSVQHWGEAFVQIDLGGTNAGKVKAANPITYEGINDYIKNTPYPLVDAYMAYDEIAGTKLNTQFFANQYQKQVKQYYTVTLDLTLSEKLDSNTMEIYLDGHFVQKMSRGYDVVKALMQWAKSTIYIDDFTISHQ